MKTAAQMLREIKAEADSLKEHNLTYIRNLLHLRKEDPLPENIKQLLRTPLGRDPKTQKLMEQIPYVSRSSASVLIRGATGTGKGGIAELIHFASGKKPSRFIRLNLAGYSSELAWGHVVGHTADAFTGANYGTLGSYCLAHDGTLFIDEFDDISPEIQMLLLDLTQRNNRRLRRLGANAELLQEIKSGFLQKELTRKNQPLDEDMNAIIKGIKAVGQPDVRLLFGLSQNIQEKVEKNIFRVDLYYRINILTIYLPKLEDRKIDFLALIGMALSEFDPGNKIKGFSPHFCEGLSKHTWPGDVRQLRNVIQAAIAYADDGVIKYHDWLEDAMIEIQTRQAESQQVPLISDLERVKARNEIANILNLTIDVNRPKGNICKAVKFLKEKRICKCSDTTIKNMIANSEIKFKDGRYIAIL